MKTEKEGKPLFQQYISLNCSFLWNPALFRKAEKIAHKDEQAAYIRFSFAPLLSQSCGSKQPSPICAASRICSLFCKVFIKFPWRLEVGFEVGEGWAVRGGVRHEKKACTLPRLMKCMLNFLQCNGYPPGMQNVCFAITFNTP